MTIDLAWCSRCGTSIQAKNLFSGEPLCVVCIRWEAWYTQTHKSFPPPPEQLIIPEFVDEQVLFRQIQSLQQTRDWLNQQIEEMDDELTQNQDVINSQKRMILQLTTEKIALEQRHHELVAALRSAHTDERILSRV
jgi:hypothetical protein